MTMQTDMYFSQPPLHLFFYQTYLQHTIFFLIIIALSFERLPVFLKLDFQFSTTDHEGLILSKNKLPQILMVSNDI